jgi:iron(III) transport system permease protein
MPLTFPGTVVGVALATIYLRLPVGIYGTVWILLIAFVTRFLPYGVRAANSTLLQIHAELEEAAAVSGASVVRAFFSITLPLVLSGTIGTFIYIVTLVVRELPSVVLLYGPDSRVIAVQLFEMWESASFNQAAALGLMLIAFLGMLAVLMRRFQTEES